MSIPTQQDILALNHLLSGNETESQKQEILIINASSSPLPIALMVNNRTTIISPGQVLTLGLNIADLVIIRTNPALNPEDNPAIEA